MCTFAHKNRAARALTSRISESHESLLSARLCRLLPKGRKKWPSVREVDEVN